jgi:transcriptional regulator with XRE-family HTH domain
MTGDKNSKRKEEPLDESQEFVQKICDKIRTVREATGLSQEKFALQAGIDRTQWGNMETGVDMRLSTLYRAVNAFGMTPAEFFKDFK